MAETRLDVPRTPPPDTLAARPSDCDSQEDRVDSPFPDRLLRAAMKRRCLDTFALRALMKATHLLGLALAERLRQYRDSGDRVLDRFANLQEQALHVAYLGEAVEIHGSRWEQAPGASAASPRL
jgi:hypothetical protein